ncbi:MAG: 2-phospho-L-lactate transferase [Thaumarchaeota archaeon]|nr:2-phospho-L-lactate transferase [Nitrososphaerota archaeon]
MLKVVALAGGTGSAKILRGLSRLRIQLTIVGNVGDNVWMHGLYICPDLDIAMYTLAGVEDKKQGWGIRGDSFETLKQLRKLGQETWFKLGDRDLATHILRTRMLKEGATLTEATDVLCKKFGVRHQILPVTNHSVETQVKTRKGALHLQEFWVRDRGRPAVRGVDYNGGDVARATKEVLRVMAEADRVVVCPANPVTSIGPILAVGGMQKALKDTSARVSALSPMIGRAPFSGPAAKLMEALGMRPDSVGVAERYSDFLDALIVDPSDGSLAEEIERLGVKCSTSQTRIRGSQDETRLARELIEI